MSDESPVYTAGMALAGAACMLIGAEAMRSSVTKLKKHGLSLSKVVQGLETLDKHLPIIEGGDDHADPWTSHAIGS